MHRRRLLTFGLCALLAGALPARADIASAVAEQLAAQGFDRVSMQRTLLGRLRVTAESDRFRREIIIDPRTGEVLRDLLTTLGGNVVPTLGNPGNDALPGYADEDGGRGRGRGRGGDDIDDDDDDDDDDSDDDDGDDDDGDDDD